MECVYKKFRLVNEQIDYLRKYKKISVTHDDEPYFTERNYIELINPYKELICSGRDKNGNHIYKNQIGFSSILELSKIDDYICDRLFPLIRSFEKRFRNAIVHEICTNFLSSKYTDKFGIAYVTDIATILDGGESEGSVIAPNLKYVLTRNGYNPDDENRIHNNKNLLDKLLQIGTGNQTGYKTNRPIQNAVKSQGIAPFWLIASVLDFGDLQLLFSMQEKSVQGRIIQFLKEAEKPQPLSTRDIFRFMGRVERIRKMRNAVNHYVPIFPLLLGQVQKKMEDDQDVQAISLLKNLDSHWMGQGARCIADAAQLININRQTETLYGIQITNFNRLKFMKLKEILRILEK